MKLLLIGGTGFLGSHLVEAVLKREHELTLFNRGQSNPTLFSNVEQLHGNRDGGLSVLQGRRWDAVIDICGYVPRVVGASAQAVADMTDHYTFISSISVYADFSKTGIDELAPVATLADERVEDVTNETYGALKALSEQAAERAKPGRTLVIRPGLIVGPGDHTDRFTYWPYRVAQGGEMLAPGDPTQQTQFIDARDLAAWIIRMVEERKMGTYNATGPDYALPMGRFLDECKTVTGSDARFVWVSDAFLTEHEVELPLYAPEEYAGARAVDCSNAIAAGLTFRPVADTIRDTLAWKGTSTELKVGLKPEQEQQLLQALRS
ncbi:MAG: SDR family oxidoreductase [Ktedonobacteraceae bacterium]